MHAFHIYKALHIVGLIFFLMGLSRLYSVKEVSKFLRPMIISSGLVTLSTGLSLTIRWGLLTPVAPWIWVKFASMALLMLMIWFPGPNSKFSKLAYPMMGLIIMIATYFSIYKPL